jgi:hypothetical protein
MNNEELVGGLNLIVLWSSVPGGGSFTVRDGAIFVRGGPEEEIVSLYPCD